MSCRSLKRTELLSSFCCLAAVLFLLLTLEFPVYATDDIERLSYDASALAERGLTQDSIRKIDQAIALALAQKRPIELIDRLKVKKTTLLLTNHSDSKGLEGTREILSRKTELIREMNRDPEIGVEIDDLLSRLMAIGQDRQSVPALKQARALCDTFPQFKGGMSEKVYEALFRVYATTGRWPEAQELAQRAVKEVPDNPAMLARLYHALRKQHKEKEAAAVFKKLRGFQAHNFGSAPEALALSSWLDSAEYYEEALLWAEKAYSISLKEADKTLRSKMIGMALDAKALAEYGLGKLAQAEADARKALSIPERFDPSEIGKTTSLLERILRAERKNHEAEMVRRRRKDIHFEP